MKKNKGFTLVELLAVIVILAVVSIVAIPIVINLIEESKKGALKDSVEGLTKAADMYYFQNMKNAEEGVQIEIINNEQTAPQEPRLNYKGEVKNGFVLISYDGKVAVCVDDGKYFASRALDSKVIVADLGSCTNEFDDELNTFITVGSANYTGLRLNMKAYKDIKSLPNTASEGTVAVITDTKISGYYISPTAPEEPKDGIVWVVQNNDSEVFIKTKTSKTGVSYVLQYEESDWAMKDAYVYNDEWAQLSNYNLEFSEWKFGYTGHYEEFKAPYNGYYEIQLWGASGGSYYGLGGYTKGDIYLDKDETIYIYVGQKGRTGAADSWNGGGGGGNSTGNAGGGATDIRTVPTSSLTAWNERDSLRTRIMVAAGGGGDDDGASTSNDGKGAPAGGLTGYTGTGSSPGGTQISGAAFGYGSRRSTSDDGGGGGGWYGGYGGAQNGNYAGGGGSSYISGHEGCVSIDSDLKHNGSIISYTGKYFINTKMIDGKGYEWTHKIGEYLGMPKLGLDDDASDRMSGNNGAGYAKIKFLRFTSLDAEQYYNLGASIEKTWLYNYMGYYQKFTAPKAGTYKIELWGASGGSYYGRGGYTSGEITLKKNQVLYVYVGQKGPTGTSSSWNGGGGGGNSTGNAGGGATDIRIVPTSSLTTWDGIDSLKTRIMVAGGGGGDDDGASSSNDGRGGAAGGLTGYAGTGNFAGGTQVSGAGFGYGSRRSTSDDGGGGAGWYGGLGATTYGNYAGGGGSSYISGHEGCVGMNENTTMVNTSATKIEDSYSYTGFIFKNTEMIDGNGYKWTDKKGSSVVNMPTFDHSTMMTGNSGHGYARITFIK